MKSTKKTETPTPVFSTQQPDRLLRLPEVLKRIPISRSAWWKGVREGIYPASLKLSERTTVWKESDIQKLIENAGK